MKSIISRQDAQAQGLKKFYTGISCKNNHDSERYVKNGGCCQCINWSVAEKAKGLASNVAYSMFAFDTQPVPSRGEMRAALLHVAKMRWHESALAALRADPTLAAQYVPPPTPQEIEAAQSLLAAAETRTRQKTTWSVAEHNAALRARQENKS